MRRRATLDLDRVFRFQKPFYDDLRKVMAVNKDSRKSWGNGEGGVARHTAGVLRGQRSRRQHPRSKQGPDRYRTYRLK